MVTPVDILLVDDNPAKVLALETALAPLGQNLVTANSGREALRQLLNRTFATVILDVNMPGMDGFETAQLIRGRPASATTPIIFVSAINLTETDALRGYALGAVDYITAPVIPEILRAKVSVFVDLHRKTEEARRHLQEVERRTQELQASQQQLRLAERMAALGTLSAGVGHDMGNLLLPIQAQLESLDLGALPEDVVESIKSIGVCVKHLRRLANGLRLLALDPEQKHASVETTSFGDWWPEIEPVLRNVLPSGAALTCSGREDLPRIRIAPHLLGQVAFNLVQNAADAMRAAGRIGNVAITAEPEAGGSRVRIAFADNGPGMTDEIKRRCLEPFFTTKARGISTGLGLSLVHGIVQRCGGELRIESRLGEGTTFAVVLPAAGPAPGAVSARAPVQAVVSIADPRLRSLAGMILRSHGASVADRLDEVDGPAVWVVDRQSMPDGQPEAFLRGGPRRHVVLLGREVGEAPREHATGLGDSPSPSLLRDVLRDAIGECVGDPSRRTPTTVAT